MKVMRELFVRSNMQPKQLSRRVILLLAALLLFTITGCKSEESNPIVAPTSNLGQIEGYVKLASTGKGVALVNITTKNSTHSVNTDSVGFYRLPNVRPGNYTLTAVKAGYDSAVVQVSVDSGKTTKADFIVYTTQRPGGITGRVIDQSSGAGLDGVKIETSPFMGLINTDVNGYYSITNMPVGSYNVTAFKYDFVTKTYKVTVFEDSIRVVDFSLEPLYGIIEGKVLSDDSLSIPISGANITTNPATNSITTGADGTYRIVNVPKLAAGAKYTVKAVRQGYTDATVSVDLIPGKTTIADILMKRK